MAEADGKNTSFMVMVVGRGFVGNSKSRGLRRCGLTWPGWVWQHAVGHDVDQTV